MSIFQALALAATVVAGVMASSQLVSALLEWRQLARTLDQIVPGRRITTRQHLIDIKGYLSRHISFDVNRRDERRPLLRSSAATVLKSGYGFCGENARVAIWLLRLGGVRAHRLYIEGERWGHTAVEHVWHGRWRLFDAHADPMTLLPDQSVARIDSSALSEFPMRHDENPWVHSYRVKLFHMVRPFRRFEQWRPPGWLGLAAESPQLLRATACGLAAVLGLLVAWWA